jgi:uncharacterized FlaG/YvyC family protein
MEVTPINKTDWIGAFDAVDRTLKAPDPTTQIIHAIRQLNKAEFMGDGRELKFTRDEETQRPVIKIVNRETGEVIDEVPPQNILHMLADLDKKVNKGKSE